jgi:hypothetical protein
MASHASRVRKVSVRAAGMLAHKVSSEMTSSPDFCKIRSAQSLTLGGDAVKLHDARETSKKMPLLHGTHRTLSWPNRSSPNRPFDHALGAVTVFQSD